MAGMREQQLRQRLEALHTELQRADTIDERTRELLRSVLDDIEDLLERKQKQGTPPDSIIERLREAVRAFENTHPTLTNAIGDAFVRQPPRTPASRRSGATSRASSRPEPT